MEKQITSYGIRHEVTRANLYWDAIALYREEGENIMQEYPFRIKFKGENAVDCGGVSRDMLLGFWEVAYQNLFDGGSLLTPLVSSDTDMSVLPTVGTIVSHGYLACGFIPVRIAFPSLAAILLGPMATIPHHILVDTFVNSLSAFEAGKLKTAMQYAKQGNSFPADLEESLVAVFSRYGARRIPSSDTLEGMVIQASKYEFLIKPFAALSAMRSGIPQFHAAFWKDKSVLELFSIYDALSATARKVLKLLGDIEPQNANQARVLSYLTQFIGNMKPDELRAFLRFTTGSSVCSGRKINVQWNTVSGVGRRPVSHTCSYQLDLSETYRTSLEFITEFQTILAADENSWEMDAL